MSELQREFIELSRAQRAAYFAWQNAPAGSSIAALAVYNEASKRQREFELKARKGA